jgi:hypothetical protein
MMKKFAVASAIIFATSSLLLAADLPEKAEQPVFKVNDTWTYRVIQRVRSGETKERHLILAISRVGGKTILQSAKYSDSSMPPIEKLRGSDLSVTNSIGGKEVVIFRPFDFPLEAGKTWGTAYERPNPTKTVKLNKMKIDCQAVGWEEVEVPAGKFRAFKVEGDGSWYNEFNPTAATTGAISKQDANGVSTAVASQKSIVPAPASGRLYRASWYVPEIKREVKYIEEEYTTDGGLSSRNVMELESYKVGGHSGVK